MTDIKTTTIELIKRLPDDVTLDDILDTITLRKKILEGLKNLDDGDFITDAEMQKKIAQRIQDLKV
jgi:hypothetical protein